MYIGIGILGMPNAFGTGGWLTTTVLLILICWSFVHGIHLLLAAADKVNVSSEGKNYGDLVQKVFQSDQVTAPWSKITR